MSQAGHDEERREALVRGLRNAADFIEAETAVPVFTGPRLAMHIESREEFMRVARAIGEKAEILGAGEFAYVERRFGPVVVGVQAGSWSSGDGRALAEEVRQVMRAEGVGVDG